VAFPGSGSEVVQPFDLLGAQLEAVGRRVFLDAGDSLGAGNRGDVVALREQPGQSDLCRCCTRLGGNSVDFIDDAQVALEVLSGEARVGLAPVVVGELVGGADRAGKEAVAERRVRNEARRIVAGAASDRPMCRILPSATSSARAPTVSSMGVFGSTRCW
jgi:hypothetical protein